MKRGMRIFGLLLMIASLLLFLYPDLKDVYTRYENRRAIREFQNRHVQTETVPTEATLPPETTRPAEPEETTEPEPTEPEPIRMTYPHDEAWERLRDYNKSIAADDQAGMSDAWVLTQNPVLVDLGYSLFGYIEIPKMELSMPLYIGASTENMAKGATVLGQSSMPIGGYNTNSVIAGHRGFGSSPYFLYIERLEKGDPVYITNPWETLEYTVFKTEVIMPSDIDAVKIQPGRDMVTLVTCHPYMSGGRQRYVVYCVRAGTAPELFLEESEETVPEEKRPETPAATEVRAEAEPEETEIVSSESAIRMDQMLRLAGGGVIFVLLIAAMIPTKKKKK